MSVIPVVNLTAFATKFTTNQINEFLISGDRNEKA
jgi:hypothetical protein